MGRATVDLPDPLDTPPPTSLAGTDDLLAQMAGEEIDRLLAESGVEPEARPAPAAPASKSPAAAAASLAAEPVEGRGREAAAPPRPPVVVEAAIEADDDAIAEAPPLSPAQLESDAELDALLDEMSRAERDDLAHAPAATAAPEALAPAEAAPVVDESVGAPTPAAGAQVTTTESAGAAGVGPAPAGEPVMSAAERDALSLSDIAAETDAAEERDAAASNATASGPSTFLVRLLEWLDGRLSFVPDALRDAMGKIAIVTLLNALAVLIYVLFFRG